KNARTGSWLSCPSCGQPVQVRPRHVARPVPEPDLGPFETTWLEGPLPQEGPRPEGPPPTKPEDLHPWRRRQHKRAPVLTLTLIAALSNLVFAGIFLSFSTTQ